MYEIRFKKKIQLLGYPDFPRLEITGVILRFSFREAASMAANFRSRMLHHGKISRVFSVFSPPKVANQRPVWPAYRGKKGKGWKEGEEKERREEPIVRDRGKKRARSAKVGGLLLSFFLFFFLAIFHHFLPAPLLEKPFLRGQSEWSVELIDILRVPIPDFISDLLS